MRQFKNREPSAASLSMNGPVYLSTGGHVVMGAQKDRTGRLNLSLSLSPLRFSLRMVDVKTLEREHLDEDVGHTLL